VLVGRSVGRSVGRWVVVVLLLTVCTPLALSHTVQAQSRHVMMEWIARLSEACRYTDAAASAAGTDRRGGDVSATGVKPAAVDDGGSDSDASDAQTSVSRVSSKRDGGGSAGNGSEMGMAGPGGGGGVRPSLAVVPQTSPRRGGGHGDVRRDVRDEDDSDVDDDVDEDDDDDDEDDDDDDVFKSASVEDYTRSYPHAMAPRHLPAADPTTWGTVTVLEPRPPLPPDMNALYRWQHGRCARCRVAKDVRELAVPQRFCHYTELLLCQPCMGANTRVCACACRIVGCVCACARCVCAVRVVQLSCGVCAPPC
jgi:hypothetical protein